MKKNNFLTIGLLSIFSLTVNSEEFNPNNEIPLDKIIEESIEEPYKASYSEPVSNVLQDYMDDKDWGDISENGKFRIMKIGLATFPTKDPRKDRKFLIKRSNAAAIATLNAKSEIIKTIRTTMSASDLAVQPGSNIRAELDAEVTALNDQIDSLEEELAEVESILSEEDLNKIGSLNWEDRAEALADAVIKKLDSSYDSSAISNEKKEQYNKLVNNAKSIKTTKNDLVERANALKGSITQENTTSISAFAEMPLYGIVTLATEERFDESNKKYEVGVILAWSQKSELRTRSILTGNYIGELNGSNKELRRHLRKNKDNLAGMIGSSTFKDSTGNMWILGIGAREIKGTSSSAAIGTARLTAQKEAAVALYSTVSTKQELEQIVRETMKDKANNITEVQAVESFASSMSQSFKDRDISGGGEVYSREIKHPTTGKQTFVSVYAISAMSSESARKIEAINYKVNKIDIKNQKIQKQKKSQLVKESKELADSPLVIEEVKIETKSNNKAAAKLNANNVGYRSTLDDDDF